MSTNTHGPHSTHLFTSKADSQAFRSAEQFLAGATKNANQALQKNPRLLNRQLSPKQIAAGAKNDRIAAMNWGHAVESLVARQVSKNPQARRNIVHNRGKGPDFHTRKPGTTFDVTTNNRKAAKAHENRKYGKSLTMVTYDRPANAAKFMRQAHQRQSSTAARPQNQRQANLLQARAKAQAPRPTRTIQKAPVKAIPKAQPTRTINKGGRTR